MNSLKNACFWNAPLFYPFTPLPLLYYFKGDDGLTEPLLNQSAPSLSLNIVSACGCIIDGELNIQKTSHFAQEQPKTLVLICKYFMPPPEMLSGDGSNRQGRVLSRLRVWWRAEIYDDDGVKDDVEEWIFLNHVHLWW